jgi:hypothetical protein
MMTDENETYGTIYIMKDSGREELVVILCLIVVGREMRVENMLRKQIP